MTDIIVRNWNDLNDKLYHGSWNERLSRYRSNYVFRGLSDASYELKTSLARLGKDCEKLESHLLRNFRKYSHRDAAPGDSAWSWLAVAQHHGLPTRLMDWTYSPYVAAHFATANLDHYNCEGVIWCVDYVRTNQLLPGKLKAILDEEGSNAFTVQMLDRVSSTIQEFDSCFRQPNVVFFEPPSLDERIINQGALFSMMSSPVAALDEWLAQIPDLYYRVIIPAEVKWEIRDKLDQANITERVLFPGLDGLTQWMRRYYLTMPGEDDIRST